MTKSSLILLKPLFSNKKGGNEALKMTPSQLIPKLYYSSLTRVTSAWYIITRKGRNSLTSFRGVVHHSQIRIENALDSYCKLNTIDFLRLLMKFQKKFLRNNYNQNIFRC